MKNPIFILMKTTVNSAFFPCKPLLSLGLVAFFSFLTALQSCSKNDSGPGATQINATIAPLSTTNFTLTFDKPVAGLETSNISIDNNITIKSVTHTSDTEYSIVTNQPINYNTKYNITLTKIGYTFDNIPLEIVTTVITATVAALSTTSFTLTFDKPVTGLETSNITLDNGATVTSIVNSTTTPDLAYIVNTTSLTPKATYTVTINLAGYTFNSPLTFTGKEINNDATLTSFILKTDTSTFETKNPVEGTTALNNAPRLIQNSVATLTATAQLAGGATISPDPATVRDYTTAKTFTVTSEDGKATKTYTFSVPTYNATSNPYGVYTAADLNDVRNNKAGSYKMMNNITLPTRDAAGATATGISDYDDKGWLPIAHDATVDFDATSVTVTNGFTGSFDGGNFYIDNFYINRNADGDLYTGLFGVTSGATISNAGIRGSQVKGGRYVGALAGYVEQGSVSHCYAEVAVRLESSVSDGLGSYVGGLLGVLRDASLSSSYSSGNVSGALSGIYSLYIGGLAGSLQDGNISDCFSTGNIDASSGFVIYGGGLAGWLTAPSTNCYSVGNVVGTAELNTLGGLGGFISSNTTYTNCYRNSGATITANGTAATPADASTTGITAKTLAQMQADAFTTLLGTTIWGRDASKNNGLPFIKGVGVGR